MKAIPRTKKSQRERRHRRVRGKIRGTKERPRASVFRSSRHIYVQFIDDDKARTILGFSSNGLVGLGSKKAKKLEIAKMIGRAAGERARKKGIREVVFDRGGYRYHGRVRAIAEGLREAGLKF